MSERKAEEKIIRDIDEAEAVAYKQVFGIFDKDNGDFIKIKSEEKAPTELKKGKGTRKPARKTKSEIMGEIDLFIQELSEKEISSMAITIKISGIAEEYVNDEKAGTKYLSKEAQVDKIKEAIKGFKNIVIVHSEEELQKLQEDFEKKQEKSKAKAVEKSTDNNGKKVEEKAKNANEVPKVRTQVYIRISEKDYEAVRGIIEKENIKIMANKVKTRDDKSGINMVIQSVDVDKIRNIISQNNIPILQDVDGNIDWEDIKERSNKFENVTVEQLREFQSKNEDKFDYIAFRKDDSYTIFADKKCDIAIGTSGRKTVKQIDQKVKEYKQTNLVKKDTETKIKTNNSKEAER